MDQHQLCFETLANQLRLDILRLLEQGARNVRTLAAETGAERSRVSHALQVLRDCNLVNAEKQGREVCYSLNKESPVAKRGKGTLFTLIEEHAKRCATCHKHGGPPQFEMHGDD